MTAPRGYVAVEALSSLNGSSAFRVGRMSCGGVGTSGFGREGARSMVEECTGPKAIVIRQYRG